MPSLFYPDLQPLRSEAGLVRCWQLLPGHAVGLRPRTDGVLRVAQGRAWVTWGVGVCGHGNEAGDHVVWCGHSLTVPAGCSVVMESLDAAPVRFDWTPAAAAARSGLRGREAWAQAQADLVCAVRLSARALLRVSLSLLAAWPLGRPLRPAARRG